MRCVAIAPTDGLPRGAKARDTGQPITVPWVGTLGRVFNLLGQPVDEMGPVRNNYYPITGASFEQSTEMQSQTGIR